MKRIAVVGIGRWGKNLVREFSKFATISKCVHQGNLENIRWLNTNYPEIPITTNIEDILNDPKIDAIAIATPIHTHYKIIKNTLESGKHVFVEKPMTQTINQANDLIKIAKRKNLSLFVGYIFLYNQIFKKIKKINERESIININFNWQKFGTFNENIYENLLSHDLSIVLELLGTPKKFNLINTSSFITNVDSFSLQLEYSKNKKCSIIINRLSNTKKKTITFFTKKNLYIWDENTLLKLDKKSKSFKIIYETTDSPLYLECKNFISNIKNNSDNSSAFLAKEITKIVSKINKF
tara:strand:+ start:237 stop:1121 length:885 start_codon:yes stop_codon:yes gene_type:complete